jgi:Ca2+-binding RTX toxin-like protein
VGSNIVVTFSEAVKFGTGNIEIRAGSSTGTILETYNVATNAGVNLSISTNTLTINPTSDLASNTDYYVTFANGAILDSSNNAYAGTSTYNFVTAAPTSTPTPLTLVGTASADTLTGGAGNDIITGAAGTDTLNGGDGNDLFIVALTADHTATETINGGNGTADEIRFTSTTASTLTLSSNITNVEKITIGTGTAASAVTTATKALNINAANLTYGAHITGNAGNNILTGTLGYDDTLIGGLGNDTYVVNNAGDVVTEVAGAGTDTIQSSVTYTASTNVENLTLTGTSSINATGNTLNNTLTGNSGINNLSGSDGNDTLSGSAGNDILSGGNGTDLLFGGLGNDTLTGGLGNDAFIFNTALNATSNRDTITDFSHADDTIQLSKSVMSALGVKGTLSTDDFKFSTQALDASDRIIYNQTSGALFYDADGSGSSAAVQIASIGNLPTDINYTDFIII